MQTPSDDTTQSDINTITKRYIGRPITDDTISQMEHEIASYIQEQTAQDAGFQPLRFIAVPVPFKGTLHLAVWPTTEDETVNLFIACAQGLPDAERTRLINYLAGRLKLTPAMVKRLYELIQKLHMW